MDDACYLCRRTQSDLDRLNEELRTHAYLAYFSRARSALDDQRRRLNLLQRLKDEESGDAHFRIPAAQVFGDPPAYEKLMPWIAKLIEIAGSPTTSADLSGTMGDLIDRLLVRERSATVHLEEALNRLRSAIPPASGVPIRLETIGIGLPVPWAVDPSIAPPGPEADGSAGPLRPETGGGRTLIDLPVHLCTVCRELLGPGPTKGAVRH